MFKKRLACFFTLVFLLGLKTVSAHDKDRTCPVWYVFNDTRNECVCHDLKSWVICNRLNQRAYLARGLCMTFCNDTESIDVGKCPYTLFEREHEALLQNGYIELPGNISELNDFMCGFWNREGYLCSKCKSGYGLAIPNVFMNCVHCNLNNGEGWIFFAMIQLIPVLIQFLVILAFRVSILKPPINAFVTFYQLCLAILFTHSYRFHPPYIQPNSALKKAHYLSMVSVGIWAMSLTGLIHRVGITDFCVNSDINIQQAFTLTQIKSLFPLFLIAFSWMCIKLHARDCKLIVWLWKPFQRCSACCTKVWNPKLTLVDVFSTFLLLSYSRYIIVLYFLHSFQRTYRASVGWNNTPKLLYNPGVMYFDIVNHLPYTLILLFLLLVVAIPPVIVLAFYQTKCFQKIMSCIRLHKVLSIYIFVDLFQSYYKDGLDGSCDLRFTASLYMVLRILVLMSYIGCSDTTYASCETVLTFIWVFLLLLFFALVRPYKDQRMNILDSLLLAGLALINVLLSCISESAEYKTLNLFVLTLILIIIAIPQTILFIYLCYKFCNRLIKHGCVKLQCFKSVRTKQHSTKSSKYVELFESLPDRVDNPYKYCHDSADF